MIAILSLKKNPTRFITAARTSATISPPWPKSEPIQRINTVNKPISRAVLMLL
jgi:hypothetical protein